MSDTERDSSIVDQEVAERIKKIGNGFRIVSMKMRNAENGEVLWTNDDWSDLEEGVEKSVTFPKALLECEEVSREIVFYSQEEITDFKLLQKISL